MFGAKPLPEPMLPYCQLDSWEQISVKFEFEFYHFHSRKCIWKMSSVKMAAILFKGGWVKCVKWTPLRSTMYRRYHLNLIPSLPLYTLTKVLSVNKESRKMCWQGVYMTRVLEFFVWRWVLKNRSSRRLPQSVLEASLSSSSSSLTSSSFHYHDCYNCYYHHYYFSNHISYLGYNDISWHNSSVDTPILESLARDGVILEQNYMPPMCTP